MAAISIIDDVIWLKFKLIQAFVGVLLRARRKKIHSKINALEWSQHFSHYKSKEIVPDARGQLTLIWQDFEPIRDFMVGLVFTRLKKIQSKITASEWSQHYSLIF